MRYDLAQKVHIAEIRARRVVPKVTKVVLKIELCVRSWLAIQWISRPFSLSARGRLDWFKSI
jgi:hypothetical protein